jgi:hypothetical protein
MRLVASPLPPSIRHDQQVAIALSLRKGRGSLRGAARERNGQQRFQSRATSTTGRRVERSSSRLILPRCARFSRFASGRPRAANDPLYRGGPPLTSIGPRRLQTTRAEGRRRGCRVILGDRRSEFRPHFAAHTHENGHDGGGERQTAIQISPNSRPDARKLLIAHRGAARFISGRQKGHVVAERRHRCPRRDAGRPTSGRRQNRSSMECTAKRHSH